MERDVTAFDRGATVRMAARSIAVLVAFLVVYFVAPVGERSSGISAIRVSISLIVLAAVIIAETIAVVRSDQPGRRAVRALTVMVSLLLVVSATTYLTISTNDASAFTEPLDHVDALYLSMMTLTTVGFGDIGAVSAGARVAVMVQMIFNFVTIGVSAKVMLGRVRGTADTSSP